MSNSDSKRLIVYDFDPRNLPPEYLRAVGLVAMASAQTESVMQDFIAAILGVDNIEGIALSTHMSGPLKNHVARAVIELNAASVDVVDNVDDMLDAISAALSRRNAIVHTALIIHPETGEIFSHRLKARGSLQPELVPISVKEIEQDAAMIYEVGLDLLRFMAAWQIGPRERKRPIREPIDRSKEARAKRRILGS